MSGIVGVDLGGTFVKAGLVRDDAVVATGQTPTEADRGAEVVIGNIVRLVRQVVEQAETAVTELAGVGVAVPSPISADFRTPVNPPNLSCLKDVAVAERVAESLGTPGVIENDANAAALGEFFYGRQRGTPDLVVLTLGTGVGGGVITAGHLLRGSRNASGELGHILVDPAGRVCGCGRRGCLEAQVNISGILHLASQYCPEIDLDAQTGPARLAAAARGGNSAAQRVYDQVGKYLGRGITDLLNVLGPAVVILTGGVSRSFDLFCKPMWQAIETECGFAVAREGLMIETSELGQHAAILGAAAAFRERGGQSAAAAT